MKVTDAQISLTKRSALKNYLAGFIENRTIFSLLPH